jgi:hypothetical protein
MTSEQTKRRVLSVEEFTEVVNAAAEEPGARLVGSEALVGLAVRVLAAVGFLTPPPEPEGDGCTAMWPTPAGDWQQCIEDPGHDDTHGHDSGEWGWPSNAPEAIAPRPPAGGVHLVQSDGFTTFGRPEATS